MSIFNKKRTVVVLEGSLIDLFKLLDRFGKSCQRVTYLGSSWRKDDWEIQLNLSAKDWDIFKDMIRAEAISKNVSYDC